MKKKNIENNKLEGVECGGAIEMRARSLHGIGELSYFGRTRTRLHMYDVCISQKKCLVA